MESIKKIISAYRNIILWVILVTLLLVLGVSSLWILKFKHTAPIVHTESVSGKSEEIQKILATRNTDERVKWYLKLIERAGPEEAQEELQHSGLPFDGEAHLLNHTVGDYLYRKYGPGGLTKCKEYFLASCYHGFVLHAIGVGGMAEVGKIMNECRKGERLLMVQCAHAVGHGFLAMDGYSELIAALKDCDRAAGGISDFPLFNCHDGVFMENIWGIHGGEPSPDRWVKEDDPNYPCDDVRIEQPYQNACWSNQPALMYQLFKGDIKKVGEYCSKVGNAEYQKTCFNGLARQIHPVTNGSVDETFKLCSLLPKSWADYCVSTVAVSALSVGDEVTPFAICARIANSAKEECYSYIFGLAAMAAKKNPQAGRELCGKILDNNFQDRCLAQTAQLR